MVVNRHAVLADIADIDISTRVVTIQCLFRASGILSGQQLARGQGLNHLSASTDDYVRCQDAGGGNYVFFVPVSGG